MRWWPALLVVILVGCGNAPTRSEGPMPLTMIESPVVGPTWELLLLGTDERWQGSQPAYFSLSPNGKNLQISGSDGCNRMRGVAKLGERQLIAISELSTTRMACGGVAQASRVAEILSQAHRYLIDHDRLVLMGRDGRVLGGFRRQG